MALLILSKFFEGLLVQAGSSGFLDVTSQVYGRFWLKVYSSDFISGKVRLH